jgi:hypothetical protein
VDEQGNRACSSCGGPGPFGPNANAPDGLKSACMTCLAVGRALYRQDNPDSVWESNLRRWNITPTEYLSMLEAQGGVCALCGEAEVSLGRGGRIRRLSLDHDHECCPGVDRQTGEGVARGCGKCFRGLLCDSCNQLIGKVEAIGLEKIIMYLWGVLSARLVSGPGHGPSGGSPWCAGPSPCWPGR